MILPSGWEGKQNTQQENPISSAGICDSKQLNVTNAAAKVDFSKGIQSAMMQPRPDDTPAAQPAAGRDPGKISQPGRFFPHIQGFFLGIL